MKEGEGTCNPILAFPLKKGEGTCNPILAFPLKKGEGTCDPILAFPLEEIRGRNKAAPTQSPAFEERGRDKAKTHPSLPLRNDKRKE
ncbi:hypothetical protein OA79_02425 [Marinomonas sp. TW1]|nr:hypothetical protein OA79_02425 [Marinomonas sp. TW1]